MLLRSAKRSFTSVNVPELSRVIRAGIILPACFCIGTALENHGHGCGGPTRTQPANGAASFIKAMNARNFYARLLSPLHTLSSSVLPVRDVRAVAVLPGFSTGL